MNWRINRVSILTVTISSMTVWVGFYAWRIMFNNFAVETFDASATSVGWIQAAREVPGLLAFGAGALALRLTESRIVSLAIITVGVGLLFCGLSPSLFAFGAATVLFSFGFHYFEPTNSSQLLALAKQENVGHAQGKLSSWESLAGLIGGALVLVLTIFLDYRMTFYIFGAFVTLVGIYLVLALPPNRGASANRKITIKREYRLYYVLSFLRGCRRHIFTTFAIFLLVKNHEVSITGVSALMLVNSLITIYTHRLLGRLSDSLGERLILAGCSFLLVFIFLGYAYITWLPALIAFYLIDNTLYGSAIALKAYLRKIASDEDLTGCLSFGMTANHITAVFVPVTGGMLWVWLGYQATFILGAAIVAIDMFFSLYVPKRAKLNGARETIPQSINPPA